MTALPTHTSFPVHLKRPKSRSSSPSPYFMSGYRTQDPQQESAQNIPRSISGMTLDHMHSYSDAFLLEPANVESNYASDNAYGSHERFPAYPDPRWPPPPNSYPAPGIRIDTTAVQRQTGSPYAASSSYPPATWQFPPSSSPYTDTPPYAYSPYPLRNNTLPAVDMSEMAALINSPTYSNPQLSPGAGGLTPTSPRSPASQGLGLTPPPGSDSDTQPSQIFQFPDRQLYTHREQLQFFKDAHTLPSVTATGPFVPQPMYKPHTNSDRRRYVEEVDLEAPIYFWANNPEECGISLVDAIHSRVRRLLHRDETVFEGRGPSVSIRLEWPGYRQWSRQIPTKDFRSPPGPITRAKLAKNVAKCVQRFISERQNHVLEDDVDSRWRVGPARGEVKLEDLVLVSIHHVSMGSWQPQLRLRRPFS